MGSKFTDQEKQQVADTIRRLREANGLSQADVAKYREVHFSLISHYESGQRDIGPMTVLDLFQSLAATPEDTRLIANLCAAIPVLEREQRLSELIQKYNDQLDRKGARTFLAQETGFSLAQVATRLRHFGKKRAGDNE